MSTDRSNRRIVLVAFLAGFGVLGLLARRGMAVGPAADEKGKVARVPFEMTASNHMVVRAKLNGKGPYRLVFDLGAPVTLLGNKAAEGSGVVKADAPKMFLFSMRGEAEVAELEVGDLKAKGVPVVVMEHPVLKALAGLFGRPLDGIMGFTFFARYKTTIDYQARLMTFEPVDYEIRDLMKDLPARLSGPKQAREIVLAPAGLWGLTVAEPAADAKGTGVAIRAVAPDSPSSAAGLKPGDLLTALDGRWTATVADAFAAARTAPAGKPVDAVVLRDGRELTLAVTPAAGF